MPKLPEVVKPGRDNHSAPRWPAGGQLNALGNVAPVGALVSGIWIVPAVAFAASMAVLTYAKDPNLHHPLPLQGPNQCWCQLYQCNFFNFFTPDFERCTM